MSVVRIQRLFRQEKTICTVDIASGSAWFRQQVEARRGVGRRRLARSNGLNRVHHDGSVSAMQVAQTKDPNLLVEVPIDETFEVRPMEQLVRRSLAVPPSNRNVIVTIMSFFPKLLLYRNQNRTAAHQVRLIILNTPRHDGRRRALSMKPMSSGTHFFRARMRWLCSSGQA